MTDEQLAAMHRLLAKYHRNLANEATLDVVQQYHADLGQRLADEAALIPRRTAILDRLHEREQQKKEDEVGRHKTLPSRLHRAGERRR
jgi:hypothetical protein